MNIVSRILAGAILASAIATPASAVGVRVEVRGSVDYNLIKGDLTGVKSGAPVVMSFNLDSTSYINSASWPTRGYRIDLASFDLNIAGVHITAETPQPDGSEALFVLRDNDPAVDGFFISPGTDYRFPVSVMIPGLVPSHELEFGRTFDVATPLHSLNILDAVGTYGFENMSSYMWTVGRFGNYGLEVGYESITISAITAVPEPTTVSLLGLGALLVLRRARKTEQA